ALDVLAEPAPGVGFLHRTTEALGRSEVLAPDVHVGFVAADRKGGDDHALDERVGIALEDVPVLERSGLSLVCVDHQVLRLRASLGDERPFSRGWKSGPAQTAEVCTPHLVDDLSG